MTNNYPAGVTGSEWQITGEAPMDEQDIEITYMPHYRGSATHTTLEGYTWRCKACGESGSVYHTRGTDEATTEGTCKAAMDAHHQAKHESYANTIGGLTDPDDC